MSSSNTQHSSFGFNETNYQQQQQPFTGSIVSQNAVNGIESTNVHGHGHQKSPSLSSFSSLTSAVTAVASANVHTTGNLAENSMEKFAMTSIREENEKLNKRLLLLRDEYVKLQNKYNDLQNRFDQLASTSTSSSDGPSVVVNKDSSFAFVRKILDFIGSLFNNEAYSDLVIELANGEHIYGHKFVFNFRSDQWDEYGDLQTVEKMCLHELDTTIGIPLFRWIYTGAIDLHDKKDEFILGTVRYATRFHLTPLVEQCEEALISFVRVDNCIYFYQISEELGLNRLCEYSSKLVTLYWDSLTESDFQKASTQFLHRLFTEKSRYPLHKAIRIRNDDLIFLLLVDFASQLLFKVNEFDNLGALPLDLALVSEQYSIAKSLINHQANVNACDSNNWPLLHRYIVNDHIKAAIFLINYGASVNNTNADGDTPLHLCADKVAIELDTSQVDGETSVIQLVELLFKKKVNVNLKNSKGDTALHRSIFARNLPIFDLLLSQTDINIELVNQNYETPFSIALDLIADDNYYFAQKLLNQGAKLDSCNAVTGDTLLHRCVRTGNEKAALFLVDNGANVNAINARGETILHLAAYVGFRILVSSLLEKNANCNLLTLPCELDAPDATKSVESEKLEENEPFDPFAAYLPSEPNESPSNSSKVLRDHPIELPYDTYNQTPLHLAILGKHKSIIQEILSYHDRASRRGALDSALLTPDLNVKNSQQHTPLSLAIDLRLTSIAEMLINAGADIDIRNSEGLTLLHQAMQKSDSQIAHFLLRHGADFTLKSNAGETYLQFAVRHGLVSIVQELCGLGGDVNVQSATTGDPVLWEALMLFKQPPNNVTSAGSNNGSISSGTGSSVDPQMEEIASVLVRYKADTEYWHTAGDGFQQTLLHRALDENNEAVAIFLIRSGCDIHCVRKPGPNGEGADDCDGHTPLHMACSWGMLNVVETLLEHNVDPNITDKEGKTALHVAVLNQSQPIIELLIMYPTTDLFRTDNYGNSPFSLAVKLKSRTTAQALTRRDPHTAEQCDGKGRNYLHLALEKNDYDSVLFLLDNKVNISARVQDSVKKAPIHLAAETGTEIILRTLVLAGADVNSTTTQNQTALHLAAKQNNYQTVDILIDLNINVDMQDHHGNNAFHIAAQRGHLETCKVFIDRQLFDLRVVNNKGYTVIHCLALTSEKPAASAVFDLLMQAYPDVDLNTRDAEGNTALLLAYMNGNGKLCRSIVRNGAALGIRNLQGVGIFNHPMPTRQLLTSLLDSLTRMPEWRDGPECLECSVKFGITVRRHHCRHCGRELCFKCSSKEAIIMKFQQDRKSTPTRVCDLCHDVLTMGAFN